MEELNAIRNLARCFEIKYFSEFKTDTELLEARKDFKAKFMKDTDLQKSILIEIKDFVLKNTKSTYNHENVFLTFIEDF